MGVPLPNLDRQRETLTALRFSISASHVLVGWETSLRYLSTENVRVHVMPVNIETALKRGVNRTVARNGLLLAAVLFVISTVNEIVGFGVALWLRGVLPMGALPPNFPFPGDTSAALFAVNPAVGAVVSLLAGLATVVLTIGALRTFVTGETERLPREHFTENMVWPGLNFIVGAVVFGVLVAFGFVLFVIPGIFLLVALVFWTVYVAIEDRSFVEGMQESWALTRGHRMRLFLLGFAVAIVGIVVSAVFGAGVIPGSTLGLVIAQVGSALMTVFSLATLAAAYDQLVSLPAEETTVTTDTERSTAA